MSSDTRIRISRSKYIERDRPQAILRMDLAEHLVGQPVMVRYFVDESQTTIDCVTAIGIKDGIGRDCYRIISLGGMDLIRGVVSELPDVSALVHGEVYLYEDPETLEWFYVYMVDSERQIEKVTGGPYVFLNIEDRIVWYFTDGVLRREGDFYTRKEVDRMHQGIQTLISELEKTLTDRLDALDEKVSGIEGDIGQSIPELNQRIDNLEADLNGKITALDNKLTTRIDELENNFEERLDGHDEWLLELDKVLFPLSLSFSNRTGTLFLTGTTQDITFKATVTRKSENITDQCTYTLNNDPITLNDSGEYTKTGVNTTTTFTLVATYTKLGITKSASNTVNFGYNFYYGVIPASGWTVTEENVKALSQVKLQTKQNITFITNLNQQKIAFACPTVYGKLKFIKDSNNLDYLSDYDIENVTINGYSYYVYIKKVESTISNFYQIFTY